MCTLACRLVMEQMLQVKGRGLKGVKGTGGDASQAQAPVVRRTRWPLLHADVTCVGTAYSGRLHGWLLQLCVAMLAAF